MNIQVAQHEEREGEVWEQLQGGNGTVRGGSLVGAMSIRDAEPSKRKIKKPRVCKDVEREQVSAGRGHREDGGGSDEVRVDIECHSRTFVGRMKTFPG